MGEFLNALADLRKGKPILIYDGKEREREADLVIGAEFVSPKIIAQMRKDAGGLICVAVHRKIAEKIGLPFATDVLESSPFPLLRSLSVSRTPYGDKPAFSLSINHKRTYTGITDNDRALTIREFVRVAGAKAFTKNFYSPGHVHLLIARDLRERRGHTELSVALAEIAGIKPITVLCEMLDGKSGNALSEKDARRYARRKGFAYVRGEEIVNACLHG